MAECFRILSMGLILLRFDTKNVFFTMVQVKLFYSRGE